MIKQNLIEVRDNIDEINEIATLAQTELSKEYDINVSKLAGITTITYWFLRKAIEHLNESKVAGENIELDIEKLIKFGITYRDSEEGEKEANFTPFVEVIDSEIESK